MLAEYDVGACLMMLVTDSMAVSMSARFAPRASPTRADGVMTLGEVPASRRSTANDEAVSVTDPSYRCPRLMVRTQASSWGNPARRHKRGHRNANEKRYMTFGLVLWVLSMEIDVARVIASFIVGVGFWMGAALSSSARSRPSPSPC